MQNKMCNLLQEMVSLFLLSFAFKISSSLATKGEGNLQTYIVFLEKPEHAVLMRPKDLDRWYQTFLPTSALKSNQPHILYSYRNVIVGFAAKITAQQVKFMERKKGFVSARPEKMFSLHITHTPSFLGLQPNIGFWNYSKYGKGVIIGLLDTGITPDHSSFSDKGMPSPPVKWKGKCEFSETTCNRKLIGARNFISAGVPPYDEIGHGTHTASTAAGSPVQGANFYGQANGTAVGIAPLAHLAMYKVCSEAGCGEAEILAAMDSAVDDGVDVLSLSLGGSPLPFYNDGIAIGAFRAIQKGTFVSCSAGNSGPDESSLSNEAPWIATVGASSVDREIRATVLLGNNSTFDGQSLFQPEDFPSYFFPLVYAGANGDELSAFCEPGSLRNVDIKGKIVLCERGGEIDRIGKGEEVLDGGGAAMILMNDELSGYVTSADAHVLPASHVSYMDGLAIKSYLDSIASPIATIKFEGTVTGLLDAPKVASFSSRGPSLASPGILKPDIIGPGVSILAAWPISADDGPNTKSTFNMISGTSMSCPHISGVAALLKSAHPDWSPAAIKSAIITTARLSNMEGKPISDQQLVPANVFDIGAGHVNPSEANNPGLVYDIQPEDYIPYLCGLGYSDKEIKIIVQRTVKCSNGSSIPEAQLNYPSFSIKLASEPRKYTRTVTNVGLSGSSFTHEIIAPRGVNVEVTPNTLVFNAVNQKATYSVTFSKNEDATGSFAQGYLTWKSDLFSVRSPIAVIFE